MAIQAGLTERRSFKDRCMWGPGNWSTKKVQERSADQHSFTYVSTGVALEGTGVDLDICAITSKDCSALLSWMSGPGHGGKFRKFLQTAIHPRTEYAVLRSKVQE